MGCWVTSRIAWEPSGRRLVGRADALPLPAGGVVPPRGAVAPGPPWGGTAPIIIGPLAWGVLGWDCWGAGVADAPASGACWVGGGRVAVPADWVVTVVSSASSTVGMGSPGAGSRCWMGWPVDGVCCTGAPWGGAPTCGIEGRPPPVVEASPL